MPIRFNSNNRVLPNNSRATDVAKDTIERIKDVQVRRYMEAFRVQGFQAILYHPLTSGTRCACVGKQQIVADILDEKGNAKPGFINELLTGEKFDIAPYGVGHGNPSTLPGTGNQTRQSLPERNVSDVANADLIVANRGGSSVQLIVQDDEGNFVYTQGTSEHTHSPASPGSTNPNYQTPSISANHRSGIAGQGTVQPAPYADDYPGADGNAGIKSSGQPGVASEDTAFDWVQRNLDHHGCTDQYGPDSGNTGHAQHKRDDLLGPMTSYSDIYSTSHEDPRSRTIVPKELSTTSAPTSFAVQPQMTPPLGTVQDVDSDLPFVPHGNYSGTPHSNPLPMVGVVVGDMPGPSSDPNAPPLGSGSQSNAPLPTISDYPLPVQTGTASSVGRRPSPIVSHQDADTFEELTGEYDNPNAEADIEAKLHALTSEAGRLAQRQAELNGSIDNSLLTGGGDALAALSDAKCPICFGHGYVGGYRVYNGWRNVQSAATQPKWLGDSIVNWQSDIPYIENCPGLEFTLLLPVNCVGVDAMNVRNGKEVVPADFYVDDHRLQTENDLGRFCDGRRHTMRVVLRRPTTITHVEIQVNQSREWVLFEFPRVTRTSNIDVIDITGQVTVNAPPMIADLRPRCVFVESTYGKPFLVLDVPTWNDRRRSVLGWDFEARVIQPTELASYLPKRLQVESQNRLPQVRDNGPGFSRRT